MKRRHRAAVVVGLMICGMGVAATAPASAGPAAPAAPAAPHAPAAQGAGDDHLDVFTGRVDLQGLATLRASGIDPHELSATPAPGGQLDVEVVVSQAQADELAADGVELEPKIVDGQTVAEAATQAVEAGPAVFRQYGAPGGLKEEFEQIAADNPGIAKLEVIGKTVQGQDIVALKVTKNARHTRDGRRPATLYSAAQHAREWITPEMVRRLAHYVVDGYGNDRTLTRLVNSTELWFVPVSNPDGYDFTFEPDQRLWRKNLHDNDGDGQITDVDGVDPNRNFVTKWGYDNEGSSDDPSSETYRGTAPGSEPETRAMDGLLARVGFEFQVNYHSAAELLLYGTGWQVSSPTPDDAVYETMAGDDASPAVPGYDPDISAELYTTNGETTEHAQNTYGTLAFTPEMSTCETASNSVPDDPWLAEDCGSVFEFPDDENLVEAEFEKNIPFAIATAQSALDPDDPVSVVGRTAPDFVIDPFTSSTGDPQPVAVIAKRDQWFRWMNFRINGGRTHRALVREFAGGERYGDEKDDFYAEYRGTVRGAHPGDSVEVWFSALKPFRGVVDSQHFTYQQVSDSGAETLVIANEDYTGVNPTYPAGVTAPKYTDEYGAALDANGISHDTWDVDAQGVPHHLGVLGHYQAVVWELGDNRLTQDPEDELTDVFGNPRTEAAVAERQQFLTMAVRDYLNEGGKLLHSGETAQYFGRFGGTIGGIWYALDGDPTADCVVTVDPFSDCLLLADDFAQYWLGAFGRTTVGDAVGVSGTGPPLDGASATFGGPAVADNPVDEAGLFTLTRNILPVDRFPLFAGEPSSVYVGAGPSAFAPIEGARYAGIAHDIDGVTGDRSYLRLSRTVDLSAVTAAEAPRLAFSLSFSTEDDFDEVVVEAAPSGTDAFTTLPDLNGGTTTDPGLLCLGGAGFDMHPFLQHYLTRVAEDTCDSTGTTGSWNAFNGDSGGWLDVAFDLSAYAGQSVDLKISYVTDANTHGVGVFVDDTRITTTGGTLDADGFETDPSLWTPEGPPAGSPETAAAFSVSTGLVELGASVTTEDTVLLGYGIEQLGTPEERAEFVGRIMDELLA